MSRIDAPRHSLDFPAGFTLLDANAFVLQLSAVLVIVNDNARAEDYQRVSLLGVCIRFARICTFTALGLTNICTRSAAGEIEKITVVRRECYVAKCAPLFIQSRAARANMIIQISHSIVSPAIGMQAGIICKNSFDFRDGRAE